MGVFGVPKSKKEVKIAVDHFEQLAMLSTVVKSECGCDKVWDHLDLAVDRVGELILDYCKTTEEDRMRIEAVLRAYYPPED